MAVNVHLSPQNQQTLDSSDTLESSLTESETLYQELFQDLFFTQTIPLSCQLLKSYRKNQYSQMKIAVDCSNRFSSDHVLQNNDSLRDLINKTLTEIQILQTSTPIFITALDISRNTISGRAILCNGRESKVSLQPYSRESLKTINASKTLVNTTALLYLSKDLLSLNKLVLEYCPNIVDLPSTEAKSSSPAYRSLTELRITFSETTFAAPTDYFLRLDKLFPNLKKLRYSANSDQVILGLSDPVDGGGIAKPAISLPCGHIRNIRYLTPGNRCAVENCDITIEKVVAIVFSRCELSFNNICWKNKILDYQRRAFTGSTGFYHAPCNQLFPEKLDDEICPECNEDRIPIPMVEELYPIRPCFYASGEDPLESCKQLMNVGRYMQN